MGKSPSLSEPVSSSSETAVTPSTDQGLRPSGSPSGLGHSAEHGPGPGITESSPPCSTHSHEAETSPAQPGPPHHPTHALCGAGPGPRWLPPAWGLPPNPVSSGSCSTSWSSGVVWKHHGQGSPPRPESLTVATKLRTVCLTGSNGTKISHQSPDGPPSMLWPTEYAMLVRSLPKIKRVSH